MTIIDKIKIPKPKTRKPMPPSGKVLKDRKKEAARLACRKNPKAR